MKVKIRFIFSRDSCPSRVNGDLQGDQEHEGLLRDIAAQEFQHLALLLLDTTDGETQGGGYLAVAQALLEAELEDAPVLLGQEIDGLEEAVECLLLDHGEGEILLERFPGEGEIAMVGLVLTQDADSPVVDGGIEEASPTGGVADAVALLVGLVDALLHAVLGQEGISIAEYARGIGEQGWIGFLVEIVQLACLELLDKGTGQCHFENSTPTKVAKNHPSENFFKKNVFAEGTFSCFVRTIVVIGNKNKNKTIKK